MFEDRQFPKFALGQVVITTNALSHLEMSEVEAAVHRHALGDWGDVCPDDKKENELSLTSGLRLLSAYQAQNGVRFWIITEADRSLTTVLLPEDY